MKSLLILLILLSTSAFAVDYQSELNDYAIVKEVAREIREELYQKNHDDVYTDIKTADSEFLAEYLSKNYPGYYEQILSDDQIEELEECVTARSCNLYAIFAESSYMGGYGTETHFVIIYKNEPVRVIKQRTYSE